MDSAPIHADLGLQPPGRRDPVVRQIVASWRRLTGSERRDGQRRTLVACSGGADSCALALALASVVPGPVLGHVVHDMRPAEEASADRDAVKVLADTLGLEFREATIAVRADAGNLEDNARRARYKELERMASDAGCPFIATGHHAGDVAETVLMRLVRGAGPRGLSGIPAVRPVGTRTLVRPMLEVSAIDSRRLCEQAIWNWCEDETNRDLSRARAAMRHEILPGLRQIEPNTDVQVARAASLLAQAASVIEELARALIDEAERTPNAFSLARGPLRAQVPLVVGEVVRTAAADLGGQTGQDRLSQSAIEPVVSCVQDASGAERSITLGPIVVHVRKNDVVFERRGALDER